MPFTKKEIPQLLENLKKILLITPVFWGKPDLVLTYHRNHLINEEEITNELKALENKTIFDKIFIEYADLNDEDDVYNRNINHSGPNNLFFKMIDLAKNKNYTKITVLETDCQILKPTWLEDLYQEQHKMTLKEWICGSPLYFPLFNNYTIKTIALIKYHINGNATYNLQHPFFLETIEKLKKKTIIDQNKGFVVSYDIGFLKFFLDHRYQFYKNIQVSKCICSCCPLEWAKEKGFSIIHKPTKN